MSANIVYFTSHACTQAYKRNAQFDVNNRVAFDISKDFAYITTEYRYEDANTFDYYIERVSKEIICVAKKQRNVSTVLTNGTNYMRLFHMYNNKHHTHYVRDTAKAQFIRHNKCK